MVEKQNVNHVIEAEIKTLPDFDPYPSLPLPVRSKCREKYIFYRSNLQYRHVSGRKNLSGHHQNAFCCKAVIKTAFFPMQLCKKSCFCRYFLTRKGQERRPDGAFVTALNESGIKRNFHPEFRALCRAFLAARTLSQYFFQYIIQSLTRGNNIPELPVPSSQDCPKTPCGSELPLYRWLRSA
jgi:hypothetical protein